MSSRKEAGVGWMIFDNPGRHNAVDLSMWGAVLGILADFESDPEIRVCVMTGAGERAFISGADIAQLPDGPPDPDVATADGGTALRALEALGTFHEAVDRHAARMVSRWGCSCRIEGRFPNRRQ